jgi:hypothetical protein
MFGALRNKFARKKICAALPEELRKENPYEPQYRNNHRICLSRAHHHAGLAVMKRAPCSLLTVSDDARRLKEQLRGKKFLRLSG